MKTVSRAIQWGVLTLLWLASACTLPAQPAVTPSETIPANPTTLTIAPTSTLNNATPTAFIPITGMDVVSLQCQFCVNEEAHAVLVMSNQVFFNVSNPANGVTCLTAHEVNGRRVLLCRGAQQASFELDVCADDSNCLQFTVTLQACALIPASGQVTPVVTLTAAPIVLTPINTLPPPTSEPEDPDPTQRPRPTATVVTTASPPVTSTTEPPTAEATEPPAASATEPAPTEAATQPPDTAEPADATATEQSNDFGSP